VEEGLMAAEDLEAALAAGDKTRMPMVDMEPAEAMDTIVEFVASQVQAGALQRDEASMVVTGMIDSYLLQRKLKGVKTDIDAMIQHGMGRIIALRGELN
jgi:hypothetical protein